MGGLELRVTGSRFLPGCAFRLAERTALVGVDCIGDDGFDAAAETRVREAFWALCPEERIYALPGCGDEDVPAVLLVDGDEAGPGDALWRLGGWVVALTVALHRWAHVPVMRGRVIHAEGGSLWLALPWLTESMLTSSLDLGLRLLAAWVNPDTPADTRTELEAEFRTGMANLHHQAPPLEWLRFMQAASARDIPFEVRRNHLKIGWARNARYLDATFTGETSHIAHQIAKDKARANAWLAAAGVPVPPQRIARSLDDAQQAAEELGWPVVIKPVGQDLSRGVVTGIRTAAEMVEAFGTATEYGDTVVVEKHVDGDSYRLLVVHGRLLAAARRVPGGVAGDGKHSIAELIEITNADPRRQTYLKPVKLDEEALAYIGLQGFSAESVPEPDRYIPFAHLAFRRLGCFFEDVWESLHPDNRMLAERAALISRLDLVGVDILTTDIGRSWRESGAVVCEVNSQPGLMPHWLAQPERDIHGEILDTLLAGRRADIPTAAITGTGAAAAASLLHRIWTASGTPTAVSSARGILIGSEVVSVDDATDQSGVRVVLNNPGVGAAVFELSASRLLESGHGCDRYGVAAVLSAAGQDAEPAASVLEMARESVVLNADDPDCLTIRSRARAPRQVLVASDRAAVSDHLESGGAAVFRDAADRRCIVVAEGAGEVARFGLRDPATEPAAALCAVALAWAQGIDPAVITDAL